MAVKGNLKAKLCSKVTRFNGKLTLSAKDLRFQKSNYLEYLKRTTKCCVAEMKKGQSTNIGNNK